MLLSIGKETARTVTSAPMFDYSDLRKRITPSLKEVDTYIELALLDSSKGFGIQGILSTALSLSGDKMRQVLDNAVSLSMNIETVEARSPFSYTKIDFESEDIKRTGAIGNYVSDEAKTALAELSTEDNLGVLDKLFSYHGLGNIADIEEFGRVLLSDRQNDYKDILGVVCLGQVLYGYLMSVQAVFYKSQCRSSVTDISSELATMLEIINAGADNVNSVIKEIVRMRGDSTFDSSDTLRSEVTVKLLRPQAKVIVAEVLLATISLLSRTILDAARSLLDNESVNLSVADFGGDEDQIAEATGGLYLSKTVDLVLRDGREAAKRAFVGAADGIGVRNILLKRLDNAGQRKQKKVFNETSVAAIAWISQNRSARDRLEEMRMLQSLLVKYGFAEDAAKRVDSTVRRLQQSEREDPRVAAARFREKARGESDEMASTLPVEWQPEIKKLRDRILSGDLSQRNDIKASLTEVSVNLESKLPFDEYAKLRDELYSLLDQQRTSTEDGAAAKLQRSGQYRESSAKIGSEIARFQEALQSIEGELVAVHSGLSRLNRSYRELKLLKLYRLSNSFLDYDAAIEPDTRDAIATALAVFSDVPSHAKTSLRTKAGFQLEAERILTMYRVVLSMAVATAYSTELEVRKQAVLVNIERERAKADGLDALSDYIAGIPSIKPPVELFPERELPMLEAPQEPDRLQLEQRGFEEPESKGEEMESEDPLLAEVKSKLAQRIKAIGSLKPGETVPAELEELVGEIAESKSSETPTLTEEQIENARKRAIEEEKTRYNLLTAESKRILSAVSTKKAELERLRRVQAETDAIAQQQMLIEDKGLGGSKTLKTELEEQRKQLAELDEQIAKTQKDITDTETAARAAAGLPEHYNLSGIQQKVREKAEQKKLIDQRRFELQKLTSQLNDLKVQQDELQIETKTVPESAAEEPKTPSLLDQIRELETESAKLDAQIQRTQDEITTSKSTIKDLKGLISTTGKYSSISKRRDALSEAQTQLDSQKKNLQLLSDRSAEAKQQLKDLTAQLESSLRIVQSDASVVASKISRESPALPKFSSETAFGVVPSFLQDVQAVLDESGDAVSRANEELKLITAQITALNGLSLRYATIKQNITQAKAAAQSNRTLKESYSSAVSMLTSALSGSSSSRSAAAIKSEISNLAVPVDRAIDSTSAALASIRTSAEKLFSDWSKSAVDVPDAVTSFIDDGVSAIAASLAELERLRNDITQSESLKVEDIASRQASRAAMEQRADEEKKRQAALTQKVKEFSSQLTDSEKQRDTALELMISSPSDAYTFASRIKVPAALIVEDASGVADSLNTRREALAASLESMKLKSSAAAKDRAEQDSAAKLYIEEVKRVTAKLSRMITSKASASDKVRSDQITNLTDGLKEAMTVRSDINSKYDKYSHDGLLEIARSIDALDSAIREAGNLRDSLVSRYEEQQRQDVVMKEESAQVKELRERLRSSETEAKKLKQEVKGADANLKAALKRVTDEHRVLVAELEERVRTSEKDAETLRQRLETSSSAGASARDEAGDLRAQLESMRSKNADLAKSFREKMSSYVDLQRSYAEVGQLVDDLNQQLAERSASLDAMKRKADTADAALESAKETLYKEMESERGRLEHDIEIQTRAKAEAERVTASQQQELKRLTERASELERELEIERDKRESSASTEEKLKERASELERELDVAKQDKRLLLEEKAGWHTKEEAYQLDLAAATTKLQARDAEIERLKARGAGKRSRAAVSETDVPEKRRRKTAEPLTTQPQTAAASAETVPPPSTAEAAPQQLSDVAMIQPEEEKSTGI